MNKLEFIEELELILDLNEGDLTINPLLAHSDNWDSVTLLGIIALLDEHFGVEVNIKHLKTCNGIEDLFSIIGNRFTNS